MEGEAVVERAVLALPLFGSGHSLLPSASSTKLRTVLGAWFGNSCTLMSPRLVCRVACRVLGRDSVTVRILFW